jgi:hypothetical protein
MPSGELPVVRPANAFTAAARLELRDPPSHALRAGGESSHAPGTAAIHSRIAVGVHSALAPMSPCVANGGPGVHPPSTFARVTAHPRPTTLRGMRLVALPCPSAILNLLALSRFFLFLFLACSALHGACPLLSFRSCARASAAGKGEGGGPTLHAWSTTLGDHW